MFDVGPCPMIGILKASELIMCLNVFVRLSIDQNASKMPLKKTKKV